LSRISLDRMYVRMFGIIITCDNEAITKSFQEDYIMFPFYSIGGENTVEIVILPFWFSITMLVACKNSFSTY